MSKMIKLAMEGMSEIPHREPENVATTEKRIELMKPLFSENTTITENDQGNYQVDTMLDDDEYCDGGQKVSAELEYVREFSQNIEGSNIDRVSHIFKVKNMTINETLLDLGENDFFLITPEIFQYDSSVLTSTEKEYLDKLGIVMDEMKANNWFLFEGGSPAADVDNGQYFIPKLKSGTDLVILFHERGHIKRESGDLDQRDYGDAISFQKIANFNKEELIQKIADIKLTDPEDSEGIYRSLIELLTEMVEKSIYEERQASKKALEEMHSFNLFRNLNKAKLFLTAALSTGLIEARDIDKNILKPIQKDVHVITDFDQDWHY